MASKQIENIELIKKKTLILTQTDPQGDMMFNAWKNYGLNADIIFRPQNKLLRLIRRIWANYFFPGYSFWYGNWKKKIRDYEVIIVHADLRTRTVPQYIHRIKPEMRIIYWYWNPVNKYTLPELTKDKNIECWSFDESDCKKYNMKKNVQYYYEQTSDEQANIEYDVFFIGHDKGRKEKLLEIKKKLEECNLSVCYEIIEDNRLGIPYSIVQEKITKSKVILEVTQKGQVGCTLRALEALFFRKKLITTNLNIINEDFYNNNNIFVYGKDDIANLKEFIQSEYDNSSEQFRYGHTIDSWLQNFFKEIN